MPPLVLLHGALGSAAQLQPLVKAMPSGRTVQPFEFAGHGHTPLSPGGFSITAFGKAVIDTLDGYGWPVVDLWGYSMGGYVALYLADAYPDRVRRVMTLATKLAWTPEGAAQEVKQLNPDTIQAKVPRFAKALAERHPALGWTAVLQHTRELLLGLGDAPVVTPDLLARLQQPIRLGLGDRDRMVSLNETLDAYRHLPQGQLEVYPGTPHPLERVAVRRLTQAMMAFFDAPDKK